MDAYLAAISKTQHDVFSRPKYLIDQIEETFINIPKPSRNVKSLNQHQHGKLARAP